jgi:hypothetical protein
MLGSKALVFFVAAYLGVVQAFAPQAPFCSRHRTMQLSSMKPVGDESPIDKFIEGIKMRVQIAQKSNASGASAKQTIADVLAGEYDVTSVEQKVEEEINSSPCGKIIELFIII